jgi:hypothetical protein
MENEKLTQNNLGKFLWSALIPWKSLLALKLKVSENLVAIILVMREQVLSIKVDYTEMTGHYCASLSQSCKTHGLS